MPQLAQRFLLLIALAACSGCASIAESLFDAAMESAVSAAFGESDQERRDRREMEDYRRCWSTPGRTPEEIEVESRGSFRKAYGRKPNLNWHAR